ncbi:von Willebrand factor A domain-containing protein 3A [Saccopteryx leptura]|uniref:von Willebrand factor A domain-containing protein 3A n=1 Tax=Saccopteryx leptura TaxID=249018 RepID=UPI00339CD8D1
MKSITDGDPKKPLNRKDVSGLGQNPASGLLVTHVNQTQDLLRLQADETQPSARADPQDWLSAHSLKSEKLTLADLIGQGTAMLEESGQAVEKMHFPARILQRFESKLSEAIELYRQRLQWLTENSKKVFGLIRGSRVGLLIGASAVHGPGKEEFQKDLVSLVHEQLSHKEKLYVLSFGATTSTLWPDPVDVSSSSLQELKLWVKQVQPERGSNLLRALKKTFPLKGLNSLVVVLGSCPDQPAEVLCDYIQQSSTGRDLHTHLVTYRCDSQVPPAVLKNLAGAIGGHYHCYTPEAEICTSPDVVQLLAETQKAQRLLGQVHALRCGGPCEELAAVMEEISTEMTKGPLRGLLPNPPKHEAPLTIEFPNSDTTSAEWLKVNGLKAKKLSLYQVLAPNAFSPVEGFVPILQKMVSSTVHERAMIQFQWHDGTVKNVHVDLPFLYEYQKQLGRAMRTYERRVEWLSLASRRIWGTVCEKRVLVLLDFSAASSMYIIHSQHALRLLLEEQLSNKDAFNVVAFGSTVESWRPGMVSVSHDSLQSAWQWALTLQCQGSRNVLSALRKAVEVDFKDRDKQQSQAIYLFTGGIPDQDVPTLSAYLAEACGGCDLHLNVCLFYVGEPRMDAVPPARYAGRTDTAAAYRELTRAAGGRFHWFGDTGIYESDDVNAIMSEMEKALNYSEKCALLMSCLKSRSRRDLGGAAVPKEKPETVQRRSLPRTLGSAKPAGPSVARMSVREDPDRERRPPLNAVTWRPLGGRAGGPAAAAQPARADPAGRRRKPPPRAAGTALSLFYTETGNNVGSVYRKYPQGRGVRRASRSIELPRKDTLCSSQEWVANYGLRKLRMELPGRVGPRCAHQGSGQRLAATRYCSAFPSVDVKGTVRHIQWTPRELEAYVTRLKKVLRRYIHRLRWLLSGSRRLFGVILEKRVCILLDTSGSMGPHLPEVKTELVLLIWEQLRRHCDSFNLISFSEDLHPWQDTLVETTDTACHEATRWVTHLRAQGSTSILQVLREGFRLPEVEGLYLLTDGKGDTSCSLILREVRRLREEREVTLHTISPSGTGRAEVNFLRGLASLTGGRYHCLLEEDPHFRVHGSVDGRDAVLPPFEGDDLRRLAQEITKARSFLWQAQSLRSQLQKNNNTERTKGHSLVEKSSQKGPPTENHH